MRRLPFAQLCPNSPLELPEASQKRESASALPSRRQSEPGVRVRSTTARRHATSTWAAQLAACEPILAQPQAAEALQPDAATRAVSVVGATQGAAGDLASQGSLELPADWQQASLVCAAPRAAGAATPKAQGAAACSSASGEHTVAEAAAEPQQRGVRKPGAAAPAGPAGPRESASPGALPAGDWAAALLESWDVRWEALLSPELREAPEPESEPGSVPEPGLGPCAPASPPAAAGGGCLPLSELLAAAEAAAAIGAGASLEVSDAGGAPAEARAGTSGAARAEDGVTSGLSSALELGGGGGHDDTDDLLAALLHEPRGAAEGSQGTLWKDSADGAPAGAARGHAGRSGPAPRARGGPRRGSPAAHASPDGRARAGKRKCSRSPSATSQGDAARRLAASNPAANPDDTLEVSTLLRPTAASSCARADSPEWEPGEWAPAPSQGRAAAAQGRARLAARLARVRAEVSIAPLPLTLRAPICADGDCCDCTGTAQANKSFAPLLSTCQWEKITPFMPWSGHGTRFSVKTRAAAWC